MATTIRRSKPDGTKKVRRHEKEKMILFLVFFFVLSYFRGHIHALPARLCFRSRTTGSPRAPWTASAPRPLNRSPGSPRRSPGSFSLNIRQGDRRAAVASDAAILWERDAVDLRGRRTSVRRRGGRRWEIATEWPAGIGRSVRCVRHPQCPVTGSRCISPGARRPDGKARGARIPEVCKRRATQPAGMPRPGIM